LQMLMILAMNDIQPFKGEEDGNLRIGGRGRRCDVQDFVSIVKSTVSCNDCHAFVSQSVTPPKTSVRLCFPVPILHTGDHVLNSGEPLFRKKLAGMIAPASTAADHPDFPVGVQLTESFPHFTHRDRNGSRDMAKSVLHG